MKSTGFLNQKREEAKRIVLDYLRSGLTKKAFCALESTKMEPGSLSYWYRIYRAHIAGDVDPFIKKEKDREKKIRVTEQVHLSMPMEMANKLRKIVIERRKNKLPNGRFSLVVIEAIDIFLKTKGERETSKEAVSAPTATFDLSAIVKKEVEAIMTTIDK